METQDVALRLNNITVVNKHSYILFVGIAAGVTVVLALILIVLLITIVISRKRYLYLASHLLPFVREQF